MKFAALIGSRYTRGLEPLNCAPRGHRGGACRLPELAEPGRCVRFSEQVAKLKAAVIRSGFTIEKTCLCARRRPRAGAPTSADFARGGAGGMAAALGLAVQNHPPFLLLADPWGSVLAIPTDTGYFGVAFAIWFPWKKAPVSCTC